MNTPTAFLMFEKGAQAIVPRGSRKCGKAMRRVDLAFSTETLAEPMPEVRQLSDEVRALLRIRCGLCPSRCRKPLL